MQRPTPPSSISPFFTLTVQKTRSKKQFRWLLFFGRDSLSVCFCLRVKVSQVWVGLFKRILLRHGRRLIALTHFTLWLVVIKSNFIPFVCPRMWVFLLQSFALAVLRASHFLIVVVVLLLGWMFLFAQPDTNPSYPRTCLLMASTVLRASHLLLIVIVISSLEDIYFCFLGLMPLVKLP